jgi:hypothetical protein
LIQL